MFIDTPSKKRLIFSIIIYFPIISLVAGTPLPFPSIFEPSQAQIALLNGINVSIAIIGSIVGAAYYLERRNTKKIEKIEELIGEMTVAHHEEMKELRKEMREAEARICLSMVGKNADIEKSIELKVAGAKELVDTRFKHLDNVIVEVKKSIDFMQQFQFGSGAKSVPPYIGGQRETQEHKDKPFEGMYQNPDSSETQKHKDRHPQHPPFHSEATERKEYEKNRKEDRIDREKASKKRWNEDNEDDNENEREREEQEKDW